MVWDSSTPTKADNARDIDEFIRVGVKQALEAFFTFKNNGLRVEINNGPEDVGDIASKQYVDTAETNAKNHAESYAESYADQIDIKAFHYALIF